MRSESGTSWDLELIGSDTLAPSGAVGVEDFETLLRMGKLPLARGGMVDEFLYDGAAAAATLLLGGQAS